MRALENDVMAHVLHYIHYVLHRSVLDTFDSGDRVSRPAWHESVRAHPEDPCREERGWGNVPIRTRLLGLPHKATRQV